MKRVTADRITVYGLVCNPNQQTLGHLLLLCVVSSNIGFPLRLRPKERYNAVSPGNGQIPTGAVMMIREPIVADKFYAGDEVQCRKDVQVCLRTATESSSAAQGDQIIEAIIGGIVPHAGWMCSGAVAARVFQEIANRHKPHTVVIFGAVHVLTGTRSAVFASGAWETPLGLVKIDERLAERLHGQTGLLEVAPHAHEREHSIEVQIPFIQHLMPHAKIVPIMVPINDKAPAVGAWVGQTCKSYGTDVVFIG